MPRASVIIPTWDGLQMLRRALDSLDAQLFRDFEVIVVDNGSTDGTDSVLRRDWPAVRLIRFESNRGFAPAVNEGIAAARGGIVILMNNDAVAGPDFVGNLVGTLDRDPELGSCAAKVLLADGSDRIDSAGIRMGLFPSQDGHGVPDSEHFATARPVFAPTGGAGAYRKSALIEVGGFDDRFFAYFEDADVGCRLQLAGYRCRFVPGAVVRHVGSATARRDPGWKFYLLMRNGLFVFFQNMPLRRLLPWAPAVLVWPLARSVLDGVPLRTAFRALLDFGRDIPTVLDRRRRAHRIRSIPWSEFTATLAPPLTRSHQPLVPGHGRGAADVHESARETS